MRILRHKTVTRGLALGGNWQESQEHVIHRWTQNELNIRRMCAMRLGHSFDLSVDLGAHKE
jgi:hypothetical protein